MTEELFTAGHLPQLRRQESTFIRDTDNERLLVDTRTMDNVSKDLLEAKLELIEARMDGRVASIESKFDAFLAAQAERDIRSEQLVAEREKRSDERFQLMIRDIDRIGNVKANVWGAMVTTIIILVAIGAFGLTAFQSGVAGRSVSESTPAQKEAIVRAPEPAVQEQTTPPLGRASDD